MEAPRSDNDAGPGTELVESLSRRESLGYQINHLARQFEQQLRIRIDRHGVTPGQFAQILALYEEEPLTQRELCKRVQIEQPTMAYTLGRMERDGLIKRVADPDDGRRAHITLTPRTRGLQGTLLAAARQVNGVATEGMSAAEVAEFMSRIERMIGNFEAVGRRR
jgi:DNA-binding MarR family transcriptional regulator